MFSSVRKQGTPYASSFDLTILASIAVENFLNTTISPRSAILKIYIFAFLKYTKALMKRLIIDMDDVIADATGQFILYYEKEFGIQVTRESLNNQDEGLGFPAHHDIVQEFPY